MSKRPAENEPEEARETKRLKLETHDTRPASAQVWMKQSLVGSKIAPFLLTAEVNNLLLTCKLQRENLDTNPNAWSPALQINRPDFMPSILAKDDQTARFVGKISRNLHAVDIHLGTASQPSEDTAALATYIQFHIKGRLDILRITSKSERGSRIGKDGWYLFANTMMFRGVSFNHETQEDQDDSDEGDIDFAAPSYTRELDISLEEYHRQHPFIYDNEDIATLRIDASLQMEEYKCKYCDHRRPNLSCFPGVTVVENLHIKLGKKWSFEAKEEVLWIPMLVELMPVLQTLELSGTTDRSREWVVKSLLAIDRQRREDNKPNMVYDCSKLQVLKTVEVQYEPFVAAAQ